MRARHKMAIALSALVVGVLPAATLAGSPASASATTKIATNTEVTARQIVPSSTPGKVIFTTRVLAASGPTPTGTVTFTVDGSLVTVLHLKPDGRGTFSHHFKVGRHSVTGVYSGNAKDSGSRATIAFKVK